MIDKSYTRAALCHLASGRRASSFLGHETLYFWKMRTVYGILKRGRSAVCVCVCARATYGQSPKQTKTGERKNEYICDCLRMMMI